MRNFVLLFLLTTTLSACSFAGDDDLSRRVTYNVDTKGVPCTLLIAYDDESGRQMDVCTEGKWEQSVRLPSGKIADISVTAVLNLNKYLAEPTYYLPGEDDKGLPSVPISVKISQRGHKMICTGYGTLCASMDDLESFYLYKKAAAR